jgi:hypothetical protein
MPNQSEVQAEALTEAKRLPNKIKTICEKGHQLSQKSCKHFENNK